MRVGTRGSRLARAQTDLFLASLAESFPDIEAETVIISTQGDRDQSSPLASFGGYGVFVKELDSQLLSGEIDVSVNSLKDMLAAPSEGTVIGAVLPRANPADALLPGPLDSLPKGARIGSSSVRRGALLSRMRPDLELLPIRGNVETRISKLEAGDYDAIVLAQAGIERLGLTPKRQELPIDDFIPAAGQGAIAIACRADDAETLEILKSLDHRDSSLCVHLEREVLRRLKAGCSAPLGVHATLEGDGFRLRAHAIHPESGITRSFDGPLPMDYNSELNEVIEHLREAVP